MGKEIKVYLYYKREELMSRIALCEGGKVYFENFTDNPLECAFGIKSSPVGIGVLYDFLEDRCFPSSRFNRDEVLQEMGLLEYNPVEIVKKTYGMLIDDQYWVKEKGDPITFEEACKKVGLWEYRKR